MKQMQTKHHRQNFVWLLAVAISLLIIYVLFATTIGNVYRLNSTGISGRVVETKYGWGIQSLFHRVSVTNLPQEYQRAGTKLTCEVTIEDVIGTRAWDVFASVRNCTQS